MLNELKDDVGFQDDDDHYNENDDGGYVDRWAV